MIRKTLSIILLAAVLAGCNLPVPASQSAGQPDALAAAQAVSTRTSAPAQVVVENSPTPIATQPSSQSLESKSGLSATTATHTPTAVQPTEVAPTEARATETPATEGSASATSAPAPQAVGPDAFPSGINPLTGLPVEDPEKLALPPALVSITNFPVSARPQAGLSFSPFVFEMYIGEGMTRYLALFYGDYPVKGSNGSEGVALSDDGIGPVRSGRLPFESLRKHYNGFLVMASASSNVAANLSSYANVFGSDDSDINSALIPATKLGEIAAKQPRRVQDGTLSGLRFDSQAPEGGKTAESLWIPFSFLNQVLWRYDPAAGAYLRYQDQADGKTFVQQTDRLNGHPLHYENVIVLFADHTAKKETLITIEFEYIKKNPALLLRDGQVFPIYWTTANAEFEKTTGLVRPIRFIDAQGNPFPLKPGQTWVEIVQSHTRFNETIDTENYAQRKSNQSPGSGHWVVHFYAPK